MSFQYSKTARSVRGLKSPEKFVLITLAWYADSGRPGDTFPSVATLARDCAMTPRGVRGILRRLEKEKLIKVAIGAGKDGTNRYTLELETMDGATPEPHSGEEQCSEGNALPVSPGTPFRQYGS
ncbi:MAG: hypothetical protein GEU87_01380 [Alphaproteobacteria bacterium]|nr:hypothetical protein [Alphaproteobacteria bacterium]